MTLESLITLDPASYLASEFRADYCHKKALQRSHQGPRVNIYICSVFLRVLLNAKPLLREVGTKQ